MTTDKAELWIGRIVLLLLVLFTLAPFLGMLGAALQPAGSTPPASRSPT